VRDAVHLRGEYGNGRRALLDATVRVVARKGLRGLTYREVAAEAGVTYGLVHHHFGSRDALVQESLKHAVRESLSVSFLHERIESIEQFGRVLTISPSGEGRVSGAHAATARDSSAYSSRRSTPRSRT
jgi:AcrR family transcriptional regulator